MFSVKFLAAIALVCHEATTQTLIPFKYGQLKLGEIRPLGWLKDQLSLSAEGLAGHEWDFYRLVRDTTWTNGTFEYSALRESAPYWFNYVVPLAWSTGNERLKSQATDFLNAVLEAQADDGWLGPEVTKEERGLWARSLFIYGLTQYADAVPEETDRIVGALYRFVDLAASMLQNNYTGLIPGPNDLFGAGNHGVSRAHELPSALHWLYDNYPGDHSENIWTVLTLMFEGGIKADRDWSKFFVEGVFPTIPFPEYSDYRFVHGVDIAEGLRWTTALYRQNGDEALASQARIAHDLVFRYHGHVSGTVIADEQLAGLSPSRGSELCMAVELMYSAAYLYRFHGLNEFAERAEQVAYNALPAMVSSDHWSHQYVQLTNQPLARQQATEIFNNVGSYGTVFGLEPNYPCCTVNHPTAYPKFLASSFVKSGDNGLLHALLMPAEVSTKLGDDNTVSVAASTNYPFNTTIHYSITAQNPFTFFARVPSWVVVEESSYVFGAGNQEPLSPNGDSLQEFEISGGESTVTVTYGVKFEVESRQNKAVALRRGPLVYALDLDFDSENFNSRLYYDPSQTLPDSELYLPYTQDFFLESTDEWRLAIDTSSIVVVDNSTSDAQLPNPIWARGAPPVSLQVEACPIEWNVTDDILSDPPVSPSCSGNVRTVVFSPYGSTKLRMAELPAIDL